MNRQPLQRIAHCVGAGCLAALAAIGPFAPVVAQTTDAAPELIEDLVAANHVLAAEGILVGFGHVSVRHDQNPDWFLIATALAPELVTADDLVVMDLDGAVVDSRGKASPVSESFHSVEPRPENPS